MISPNLSARSGDGEMVRWCVLQLSGPGPGGHWDTSVVSQSHNNKQQPTPPPPQHTGDHEDTGALAQVGYDDSFHCHGGILLPRHLSDVRQQTLRVCLIVLEKVPSEGS